MDVTAKLSRFVAEIKNEKIPAKALETAKTAVMDCLGVALAGSKEECAKICAEIARQEGAKEEAVIIGQGFKSSALPGPAPSQVERALGFPASMASGIVANFGTMTKPLHVALGARNGVLAAKLAQVGYTANPQAIDGGFAF